MDHKSKILKKLLIQEKPHQATQMRGKSTSLYNLNDFLPKIESSSSNYQDIMVLNNHSLTINPIIKPQSLITTLSQFKIKNNQENIPTYQKHIIHQNQQINIENERLLKSNQDLIRINEQLKVSHLQKDNLIIKLKQELGNLKLNKKPTHIRFYNQATDVIVEGQKKQFYSVLVQTDQKNLRSIGTETEYLRQESKKVEEFMKIPINEIFRVNPLVKPISQLKLFSENQNQNWAKLKDWKVWEKREPLIKQGNQEKKAHQDLKQLKNTLKKVTIKKQELDIYPIKPENIANTIKMLIQ